MRLLFLAQKKIYNKNYTNISKKHFLIHSRVNKMYYKLIFEFNVSCLYPSWPHRHWFQPKNFVELGCSIRQRHGFHAVTSAAESWCPNATEYYRESDSPDSAESRHHVLFELECDHGTTVPKGRNYNGNSHLVVVWIHSMVFWIKRRGFVEYSYLAFFTWIHFVLHANVELADG